MVRDGYFYGLGFLVVGGLVWLATGLVWLLGFQRGEQHRQAARRGVDLLRCERHAQVGQVLPEHLRLFHADGRQDVIVVCTPVLWLGGWSLLALISIVEFWNLALPAAAVGQSASIGAALALALAD